MSNRRKDGDKSFKGSDRRFHHRRADDPDMAAMATELRQLQDFHTGFVNNTREALAGIKDALAGTAESLKELTRIAAEQGHLTKAIDGTLVEIRDMKEIQGKHATRLGVIETRVGLQGWVLGAVGLLTLGGIGAFVWAVAVAALRIGGTSA